jgi:uncharacterized protein YhjY with autotransporter beta-barrel domain
MFVELQLYRTQCTTLRVAITGVYTHGQYAWHNEEVNYFLTSLDKNQ